MRIFLQVLVLLAFVSCNIVSDTEAKAVKKVGELYGGQINYSVGFDTNGENKVNFFELKVSESPLVNQEPEWATAYAGNIAYLFYSNLDEEKQAKYNQIRVSMDITNGESRSYKFSDSELTKVKSLYSEIEKTNKYIKYGEHTSFINQFSKNVTIDEADVLEMFNKIKSEYGMVTDIQIFGLAFFEDEEYGNCIEVAQVLSLKENRGPMLLIYSLDTKELLGFHIL